MQCITLAERKNRVLKLSHFALVFLPRQSRWQGHARYTTEPHPKVSRPSQGAARVWSTAHFFMSGPIINSGALFNVWEASEAVKKTLNTLRKEGLAPQIKACRNHPRTTHFHPCK